MASIFGDLPSSNWINDPKLLHRKAEFVDAFNKGNIHWPRITVVTPSYNSGKYIRQCIESVSLQNYPNLEHIVCDSKSTDGTQDILSEYPHLIARVEKDQGQADALNRAFQTASGDILTWLNADDMFAPLALHKMALGFMGGNIDLVAGEVMLFNENGPLTRHIYNLPDGPLLGREVSNVENMWLTGQYFYQPELFFTRDIYDRAGGYVDASLHYSMDFELWLRMAEAGANVKTLATPITLFRVHDEQKTHDEAAFKQELRELVANRKSSDERPSRYPGFNWSLKKPRIAFVNDLGYQYGAGRGHERIAKAFSLLGADLQVFSMSKDVGPQNYDGRIDEHQLFADLAEYAPDFVVFGNIHASVRKPDWVLDLLDLWPCLFVTHDFYWLTGRCAYFGNCSRYKSASCNHTCRSATQYPELRPENIAAASMVKKQILDHPNAYVLANSEYAANIFADALATRGADKDTVRAKVATAFLGVEQNRFYPLTHEEKIAEARNLNLPTDKKIVLMPGGDYLDRRKNISENIALAKSLPDSEFHCVIVGNLEQDCLDEWSNCSHFEYIKDQEFLARIYRCADFVLSASQDETFGQTLIEGAMAGAIPVSLGRGALPELIDHLGAGFQSAKGLNRRQRLSAAKNYMLHITSDQTQFSFEKARCAGLAGGLFSIDALARRLHIAIKNLGLVDSLGLMPKVDLVSGFHAPDPRHLRPLDLSERIFQLRNYNANHNGLDRELTDHKSYIHELETEIDRLWSSRSMKITKPLRTIRALLHGESATR